MNLSCLPLRMASVWSAGAERSADPALAHLTKHRSPFADLPPVGLPATVDSFS